MNAATSRPDFDDHGNLRSWQPPEPQTRSVHWIRGYRAAVLLKSRSACPYNGPELRDEWYAGYDARAAVAKVTA